MVAVRIVLNRRCPLPAKAGKQPLHPLKPSLFAGSLDTATDRQSFGLDTCDSFQPARDGRDRADNLP